MASYLFTPPQDASQYTLPKKLTEIHWLRYSFIKYRENFNSAISREF